MYTYYSNCYDVNSHHYCCETCVNNKQKLFIPVLNFIVTDIGSYGQVVLLVDMIIMLQYNIKKCFLSVKFADY